MDSKTERALAQIAAGETPYAVIAAACDVARGRMLPSSEAALAVTRVFDERGFLTAEPDLTAVLGRTRSGHELEVALQIPRMTMREWISSGLEYVHSWKHRSDGLFPGAPETVYVIDLFDLAEWLRFQVDGYERYSTPEAKRNQAFYAAKLRIVEGMLPADVAAAPAELQAA